MKLTPKAQAALEKVIEQFRTGDLSPIVEIARLQRKGGIIPADKWSLSNKVLAYIQTGSLDCRGYRQWQAVGRHVQKGSQAAFILAPVMIPVEDPDTGDQRTLLKGFKAVPVFAYHHTDGEELPEVDYTPAELPPLADVAEQLGVQVNYRPLPPDRLGDCDVTGSKVNLGSHAPEVFFHELAHAAHAKVDGVLKGGQHTGQETVAEFTASVLMQLYGLGDRTGNCWQYIQGYAKDPLRAIVKALSAVDKVLGLLLGDELSPAPA